MPESTDPESLYDEGADLYDSLFGEVDEEEVAFFAGLLQRAPSQRVLSLGCGTGRLEGALSEQGFLITGVDVSEPMLARARQRDVRGYYVAASMEALPPDLPGAPFGAVISSTLSFAYVTETVVARKVIEDCASRLVAGGVLALDLPISHEPKRLQGVVETMELAGLHYRFMWYDVIAEDDVRAVLDTDIWISSDTRSATRRAPLAVYRPQGIRQLLGAGGRYTDILFYAPHDINTALATPPPDCRRAVVIGRRKA
jgi:SAM-dependent methyltransferase